MARRRGRRRGGRKGIPVLSLAIIAGQAALANSYGGTILQKVDNFQRFYTGIDFTEGGKFVPEFLAVGWGPWIAKGFVGKLARAVGARPRLFPGLSLS